MLRIRLQRRGRRKRPLHHIVVADSRKPRDGRIIEDLGRFDNITPKNQLTLNRERAIHWLKQGAQPTDTVRSIFKNQGIMYEMHLLRWGKSEEEIEAALTEWREAREAKEKDVPTRKERQKALLEAEEKEYQKQLKKKAEEAAKEKAKQEALASDEDEEGDSDEATAEADKEVAEETEAAAEEAQAEESSPAPEASETEKPEAEAQEETAEEADEAEAQEETSEEDEEPEAEAAEESADEQEEEAEETEEEPEAEAKEEGTPAPEASESEKAEEDTSDDEEEEEAKAEADGQTSSDMLAKEAIDHIESTPLEDLKGFVTDDEDRVTVQRAWETKQEEG